MVTKKGGGFELMPANKKGQEMSTTTIILLVLGVIVLVILILGFRVGWDRVLPFLPSNNVQNIVTACAAACSTASQYDYCDAPRVLKAEDLTDETGKSIKMSPPESCDDFSKKSQYTKYGVSTCSAITCP